MYAAAVCGQCGRLSVVIGATMYDLVIPPYNCVSLSCPILHSYIYAHFLFWSERCI